MLLTTKKNLSHPHLTANTIYDFKPSWGEYWKTEINGNAVSIKLDDIISPVEMLESLIPTSEKTIVSLPHAGSITDVYLTEKHIVVYSHTKGNHWNIGGNHYKYFHDIKTGTLIYEHNLNREDSNAKPLIKERLLKAKAQQLQKMIIAKLQ